MAERVLEVCVDDAAGLAAALAGGADRIELCAALELGGLTPSAGFMELARQVAVPVRVLIRPRAGDFTYEPDEMAVIEGDIRAARALGLSGVVIGAAGPDGTLDLAALRRMIAAAKGMRLTLHRVFDLVPDRAVALEQAVDLGFDTILTSGGAGAAATGVAALAALARQAAGRIAIMPGGGIRVDTIGALRAAMPLSAVHGSFSTAVGSDARLAGFGLAGAGRRTDAALVAAAKRALTA